MKIINLGVGHVFIEDGHAPLWYRWYVCDGGFEATGTCAGLKRAIGRAVLALGKLKAANRKGNVLPFSDDRVIIRDEGAWN